MIYWTGYAKFFNEDYTADCDSVSWSTWIYVRKLTYYSSKTPGLTY